MEDIRELCKRSVVIKRGVKMYDGATEALFQGDIEQIYQEGSEENA